MSFCQLQLTCADKAEADKIANTLLNKHLIACAKQLSITSDYLWQGKIEHTKEILLIMDSRDDLFEKVETEVAKLHSYQTFVITAAPITRLSDQASQWLKGEIAR